MKIAVVGLGCRYPGANNPKELFENILAGRRYFREMPPQRWSIRDYFDQDPANSDTTYCRLAALLEGFEFNPAEFRIPQSTYFATDQAQWLALLTAREALNDADQRHIDPVRAAVILGNSLAGETSRAQVLRYRWPYVERVFDELLDGLGIEGAAREKMLERIEQRYKEPFAKVDEDSLAGALSNTIAGRVCNYFDFKGGGYTVDGACSSSLLAVIQACSGLENRDFDLALAGGVDISLDPFELVGFAKVGALSSTDIKVYDQRSNGFLPGEGCGVIVLKRLEDALADNDRIYAAITGWGYSSDGKGGLTAPSVGGQGLAIERAYQKAGYGFGSVELIEGHGTGTPVGDRVELSAIVQSMQRQNVDAEHRCGIGSIKSNIGHTKAAAGIAGLIKAILSVHHNILPPTQSLQVPNEVFATSDNLYPLIRGRKWESKDLRRAGVSSAGFGGINTHVTLEEVPSGVHDPETESLLPLLYSQQDSEVFCLGADDIPSLLGLVRNLKDATHKAAFAQVVDLAAHCAKQSGRKSIRLGIVADSPQTLVTRLDKAETVLQQGRSAESFRALKEEGIYLGRAVRPPRIVFLFPGQGSQRLNAGWLWKGRFRFVEKLWDEYDGMLGSLFPRPLSTYLFRDAHQEKPHVQQLMACELEDTAVAQPAIVAGSMAMAELLKYFGVEPEICMGHSLGEYTALWCAGAISPKQVLQLVAQRGRAMAGSVDTPGAMLSVSCSPESTAKMLKDVIGYVTIANYNAPHQTVVSGEKAAIEELRELCKSRSIDSTLLPVSNAFHSKLMEGAQEHMGRHLSKVGFGALKRLFISTITGNFVSKHTELADLLRDQITAPVRFTDAVETALAEDSSLFVEVGPGSVLSRLTRKIVGDRGTFVFATDSSNPETAVLELNHLLAFAFASGVPLRLNRVFENRFVRAMQLPYEPKFVASPCEAPVSRLLLPLGVSAVLSEGTENTVEDKNAPAVSAVVEETASVTPESILRMIQQYISRQFGYPIDMVYARARFQDDLNLDSIKSVEVVADAMARLSLSGDPTGLVALSLEEIAQKLHGMKAVSVSENVWTSGSRPVHDLPAWVRSFDLALEHQPLPPADPAAARKFVIAGGDEQLVDVLCRRLTTDGHTVAVATGKDDDGKIYEGATGCIVVLSGESSPAPSPAVDDLFATPLSLLHATKAFLRAVKASTGDAPIFLVLSREGGYLGRKVETIHRVDHLATAGFTKTLFLENPDMKVRFIDVNRDVDAAVVADIAVREAMSAEQFIEVGYPKPTMRLVPQLQLRALDTLEKMPGPALDAQDVLLISGGARGITAECALDLAKRYRLRLALVGSTTPGTDSPSGTELARNLQRFNDAGVYCSYYQCDLTDSRKVAAVVGAIMQELGQVTAVMHGAGLNRPHRIEGVSSEEFVAVMKPKMLGLQNLLAALDLSKLKLLAAFSSIIAKSGMPGNADYAYANEWLNLVLDRLRLQHPNIRCLSYNFSVWADVGMGVDSVDRLQRLGIDAIPVAEGIRYVTELLERRWPATDLIIASRLGGLRTIRFASHSLARNRFLEKVIVYQPGVELVTEAFLRPDVDRYLSDHNYQNSLLFPAVMGMEAMAQIAYVCAAESAADTSLMLENVKFNKPIVVPEEGRAVRIYAQVVTEDGKSKRVRVSIRSSVTNYDSDYFVADCVLAKRKPVERYNDDNWPKALGVDPHEFLYGSIFFQGPMFQNIVAYHDLSDKHCLVKIKRDEKTPVFSASAGYQVLLGSPEVRDSFLHAVQACVPEYRILPVAIDHLWTGPVDGPYVYLVAKERFRTDREFCYDLEIYDQDGLLVEEIRGFRCRIMEPYDDQAMLDKIQRIHHEAGARHRNAPQRVA
jgi:enediyne polyketide synthase